MRRTINLLSLLSLIAFSIAYAAENNAATILHTRPAINASANIAGTPSTLMSHQTKGGDKKRKRTQTKASDKKPLLSPPATTETIIGGKKITIKYNTPLMRGRKIMGELVPFGKVWRTGANAATTLITEADLDIGGLRVPKGTYTLYTLPGQTEWKLIVNKQIGQWGTVYNEDQDLGRVNMTLKQSSTSVEKFNIALNSNNSTGGVLTLTWENTEASVPFTVAQ